MADLTVEQWRWILLGLGLLVIILIYVMGMRSSRRNNDARNRQGFEPTIGQDDVDYVDTEPSALVSGEVPPHLADKRLVDVEITPIKRNLTPATPAVPGVQAKSSTPAVPASAAPAAASSAAGPGKQKGPEMLVLLSVLAQHGSQMTGIQILEAAHELGLKYAKSGVFDCFLEESKEAKPVFSIANVVEPGVFPPESMTELSTPGMMLFMQLPGPMDNMGSIDMMIAVADELAEMLGATLCDGHRKPMGNEGIARLRTRVTTFDTKHQLWMQSQN